MRGIFAGCDLLTGGDAYRRARKLPTGLLWDGADLASAAPIGVAGSWRFLCHVAGEAGLTLKSKRKGRRDAFAARVAPPCRNHPAARDVRVGVEGAGWYGLRAGGLSQKRTGARTCA